jgi:hypothetical protein
MAMSDAQPSGFDWDVGSAISATISTLLGNLASFVGLALLVGVPSLLLTLGDAHELIISLVDLVLGQVVTITLIYGTVQSLRGSKVGIGECLSQGINRLPAALGVAILSGLGIIVGLILLVVPGLYLATQWAVAIPAAVVEQTGVGGAFSRSSNLTDGRRWRVFGALAVSWIVTIGIGVVFGLVMGSRPDTNETPMSIMVWIIGALTQAFMSTLSGVLYTFLRRDKEGTDIESIASVFD